MYMYILEKVYYELRAFEIPFFHHENQKILLVDD
jgi:hypothetical protein